MAERRRRGIVVLALLGCSACFDFTDPAPGDPRLLDRVCSLPEDCTTSGSAERTTGITADSVGFRLGPGGGSVTITLVSTSGSGARELEVLASGAGTLRVTSAALGVSEVFDLRADYDWYRVAGDPGSSSNVVIDLGVEGDSRAEVADLRAQGLDHSGCSVAAPGSPGRARPRLRALP
ncbi:MAG: hypothetical protein HS104_31985 [Polyangiaceae bacterium]|nr:hypothetical protein [Polyangiaceae bacterium]MCE7888220.1 hypothetical protein [Sorangiineae bacterium PRO1]MCL4749107.1 hypothetical protein [Myxococcales bacterium]